MGSARLSLAWVVGALLVAAPPAGAVLLDFEGLQDREEVLSFYDGGMGSQGSVGPDYNILFSSHALGVVDADAGGTGIFANEPSPDTVLSSPAPSFVMDVLSGFEDSISFSYANSNGNPGIVEVWDELGGTGNRLATTGLLPATGTGPGDPNGGLFGAWDHVVLEFDGRGRSVVFRDLFSVGFDDIHVNPIPEPGAATLFAVGLAVAARSVRRRAHSR